MQIIMYTAAELEVVFLILLLLTLILRWNLAKRIIKGLEIIVGFLCLLEDFAEVWTLHSLRIKCLELYSHVWRCITLVAENKSPMVLHEEDFLFWKQNFQRYIKQHLFTNELNYIQLFLNFLECMFLFIFLSFIFFWQNTLV